VTFPDDTRAAVIAALMQGQGSAEVAREYNIPEGTVRQWKSRYCRGVTPTVTIKNTAEQIQDQKPAIGQLLMEYLEENLATLRAQAKFFRDEAWLRKQPASDAAVLHGVMADKAVRLIEAMSKANVPITLPDEAVADAPA
jgi:transposase-like protein